MEFNRLLIDENLSFKLAKAFRKDFPGSRHISDKSLLSTEDEDVWNFALKNNYAILTKDSDFYYMSIVKGCPPKVVRLNCGNKTTLEIAEIINSHSEIIKSFLNNDANCYLEIED